MIQLNSNCLLKIFQLEFLGPGYCRFYGFQPKANWNPAGPCPQSSGTLLVFGAGKVSREGIPAEIQLDSNWILAIFQLEFRSKKHFMLGLGFLMLRLGLGLVRGGHGRPLAAISSWRRQGRGDGGARLQLIFHPDKVPPFRRYGRRRAASWQGEGAAAGGAGASSRPVLLPLCPDLPAGRRKRRARAVRFQRAGRRGARARGGGGRGRGVEKAAVFAPPAASFLPGPGAWCGAAQKTRLVHAVPTRRAPSRCGQKGARGGRRKRAGRIHAAARISLPPGRA